MSEKLNEIRHHNDNEVSLNLCKINDDDKNQISSSIINENNDGKINKANNNMLTTIQTNEINVENSTIIGTKLVETDNSDERYLKAIKQKGEIAILRGENKLIDIIKLNTLEKILDLLGTNLKEFYYDISFGIYSCEEIVELRKTLETNKKDNNFKKEFSKNNDLNKNEKSEKISSPNDIIYDISQKKIDLSNDKDNDKENIPTKGNDEIKNEKLLEFEKKEKIFDKLDKINQKNEKDNLNELNKKEDIKQLLVNKENKMNNENIEENKKQIFNEEKLNKGLALKNLKNEDKKIADSKNRKKIKKELIKTRESQKKTPIKVKKNKKQLTFINSNNNIFNKREKLLTPNNIKNKKTNKARDISSIIQNQKKAKIYYNTDISFNTLQKKKTNNSLTYIKKNSDKNKQKNMNIKTFKFNKSNTKDKNKNYNLNIKEFYQANKDRYNNIYWHIKENIHNKNEKNNVMEMKKNNNDIEKLTRNIKCIKCGVVQDVIKNKGIYKCDKCKGFICGNCSKIHYLKNPEHKSYYINIKEESLEDKNQISNNIFYDDLINKSKISDNIKTKDKNEKIKYIRNNEIIFSLNCSLCNKLFSFNEENFFLTNCPICKGNICLNCFKEHSNKYPEHNFIKMKIILIKDNTSYDIYPLSKLYCENCKKQKNDFDNIYFCEKCHFNLCEECINKHINKYKEHLLFLIKRILIIDELYLKNKKEIKCRQCEAFGKISKS